jgi:hypothetical protein
MICRSVIVHHASRLSDSYVCHSDRLVMKYHLYYPTFFCLKLGCPCVHFTVRVERSAVHWQTQLKAVVPQLTMISGAAPAAVFVWSRSYMQDA